MTIETASGIAALLAQYRAVVDELDDINARKAALEARKEEGKQAIIAAMDAQGLKDDGMKVGGSGVTATRSTRWRAKYDPERWGEIVKWCAANDRGYLIQRRITDSKLMELIDAGEALPDGLTVEPFQNLDLRRVG